MRHPPLLVPPEAARVLRGWIDGARARPTLRLRARIVLLSGAGLGPAAIARELGCSAQTVLTWRKRFRACGVDGLRDAPRPGRPVSVDALSVIGATLTAPTDGQPLWSTRSMARHLSVSNVTVANIWRQWGVRPGPDGRVALQVDPVLDTRPVAVLGLHVDRSVRVAAVLVGDRPAPPTPVPPDRHTALAPLLARIAAASTYPSAGNDDRIRGERERFFDGLDALATRIGSGPASAPVRLIVDGSGGSIGHRAGDHPAVAVHTVVPPLSWAQVVLVACMSAETAAPQGSASVDRLRAALEPSVDAADRSPTFLIHTKFLSSQPDSSSRSARPYRVGAANGQEVHRVVVTIR